MQFWQLPLAAFLLLLLGDFLATFGYHVPEHVFGRYHSLVHHSPNRSFMRYSIRNRRPQALIPGFLAAFPYLVLVPPLWPLSPAGVLMGLGLAELHVLWRHRFKTRTPASIQTLCRGLGITTPERHHLHHQNANLAFGDVFSFYDRPAQAWLSWLRKFKQRSSRIA